MKEFRMIAIDIVESQLDMPLAKAKDIIDGIYLSDAQKVEWQQQQAKRYYEKKVLNTQRRNACFINF